MDGWHDSQLATLGKTVIAELWFLTPVAALLLGVLALAPLGGQVL